MSMKRYQVLEVGKTTWVWLTPAEVVYYKSIGCRVLPAKTSHPGAVPQEHKNRVMRFTPKSHRRGK